MSKNTSFCSLALVFVASFAVALIAGFPAVAAAAPFPLDDCTGCGNSSSALDQSATSDGCTLRVYVEMSQFSNTCTPVLSDCPSATCRFTWKIKYKTTGTCDGMTWTLDKIIPSGTSSTKPPTTGSAVLLTRAVNWDDTCGQSEDRHFKMTFDSDSSTSIDTGVLTIGCALCTGD
jgi:hypothetical protein